MSLILIRIISYKLFLNYNKRNIVLVNAVLRPYALSFEVLNYIYSNYTSNNCNPKNITSNHSNDNIDNN